jgi:hypothetical protein
MDHSSNDRHDVPHTGTLHAPRRASTAASGGAMATLYKVQVMYITKSGNNARSTMVLAAEGEAEAKQKARTAVEDMSAEGVDSIRSVHTTTNSLGVEFLGRQPD